MPFRDCGEDEEKDIAYIWTGLREDNPIINITSKDDEAIIKDVVMHGRNGECPLHKDILNDKKLAYYKDISVPFSDDIQSGKTKCELKNGKLEIEIKTNF